MRSPGGSGHQGERRRRVAALIENVLIGASIPALWLWFLRRVGYSAFQGRWVDGVLVVVLVTMLIVFVRRLAQWGALGWKDGGGGGRRHE
jgi:hypothetical protein